MYLSSLLLGAAGIATAAQMVKSFNYRGGGQGTVIFDHGTHVSRGLMCVDCHTKWPATGAQLFQTQKQGLISMADHSGDGKCFACHDGKIAFATCEQCHRSAAGR
jgi:c(7)-type cytochrome triheme protein